MLSFSPLYWVYHDNWQFDETIMVRNAQGALTPRTVTYDHAGHVHFFMMDYNTLKHASQQAYSGTQQYNFTIEDVWGPNSQDPNQINSYKLIGKPRWYFYIEEYWRRVYIQPWDVEDYTETYPNHPGRIGIRYDASKPEHSFGPFREGGGLFFFDTEINRTLPVEYWLDEGKTARQHFLKQKHYSWDETIGNQIWHFEKPQRVWSRHGRGYYWSGDNAYYSPDDPWTIIGHNKPGDIVCIKEGDKKRFFRYKLIPSIPTTQRGENYWPNPTPGATQETLRNEYLTYFDFNSYYGDTYTRQYSEWLAEKEWENTQEHFEEFVALKSEEFQRNCLTEDMQTMNYEFIGFEDYCELWEELTRQQIIQLGLLGDYPLMREGASLPEDHTDFGSEDDPFHKDGTEVNPYEVYKKYFENREEYTIPRNRKATGNKAAEQHPRESSFTDEDGARRFYSDNLYVTPVIEYQKVIHRNYERLPEREAAESNIDVWTDTSGNFGDGFSVTISIPYRINGIIQSPFSDDKGKVYPPGNYFHTMKDENKLRYQVESFGEEIPESAAPEDYSTMLEKVKRYRFSEYQLFMKNSPSTIETIRWLNENYANRPILFNPEEGLFDGESNWIEVVTHDRPNLGQVEIDSQGKPTLNGKVAQFQTNGHKEDGIWVEQCLGARVIPRVELIFEDALGHRFSRWVESMEASSETPFIGKS